MLPAGRLAPGSPESKLGYVRVATFSKQTAEKVRAALSSLKEQVGRKQLATYGMRRSLRLGPRAVGSTACNGSAAAVQPHLSLAPAFPMLLADPLCSSSHAVHFPTRPQGAERLVLDVRNNGGGLFPAGVEVGRMLLDQGDIVLIADRFVGHHAVLGCPGLCCAGPGWAGVGCVVSR